MKQLRMKMNGKPFRVQEFVGTEHSLSEQVSLFQEADLVIAPHGAALMLTVFMRPGANIIEIAYPNKHGVQFPLIYYQAQAISNGVIYHLSMATSGAWHAPLVADTKDVLKLVQSIYRAELKVRI